MKGPKQEESRKESEEQAKGLDERLQRFVKPILRRLDKLLDKRLVRTVMELVRVVVKFRHNSYGLLLSELGGYLLGGEHAPAGTKRISNLLRSRKWQGGEIVEFLWELGDHRLVELERAGEEALLAWDESVWEKPESEKSEGLCPVRSSKAKRLTHIKPGYYTPPGKPLFVPGLNWLSLLLMGRQGAACLTTMQWWTSRGERKSDKRSEEEKLLEACRQRWGRRVLHIFDQGFAGSPWLGTLFAKQVRFLLRWKKDYTLLDAEGRQRKAWQICRGKRSLAHGQVWDARRRCWRTVGLYFTPVTHPDYPDLPLWLVVSRPGAHLTPWYLLTNQSVETIAQTWTIIFAYARRWQIEMAWRFAKSELAMQSPRLWLWENRLKLLLIVSLAYAFLLSLLDPLLAPLRLWLLRHWCHRTGKRCRDASTPLYRLRSALARLWLAFPQPVLLFPLENSG